MNIYLETNLWNALCDQAVIADDLVSSLTSRNANLVFSFHCVTEMARTFQGYGDAADRGRRLFSCLKEFVEAGVLCAKQNMDLIPAELTALQSQTNVDMFISEQDCAKLRAEVEKLARGAFNETADRFISDRVAFAKTTRQKQIGHLELRTDVKDKMKTISAGNLPSWLDEEMMAPVGQKLLMGHILAIFPTAPQPEAFVLAGELLANPDFRFAPRRRSCRLVFQLALRQSGIESTRFG